MVQTGCGFLSGGRRGATAEDKEDCFGRATVALTRAIQHTYIVSPIDMAGLIRIAQTLAVYHYGYYTLKDRTVQFHEPKHVPSDAEAVLEWGLDTPFSASYGSDREWRTIPEKVSIGHCTEIKAAAHTGSHCSASFPQS